MKKLTEELNIHSLSSNLNNDGKPFMSFGHLKCVITSNK